MTVVNRSPAPHVVIVGGGGTGGALALDLVLRGIRVTLLERAEITSGTTGRHHGLLHSGARYAVNDPESAVECIAENQTLRRIAAGSFEENDGLFVGIDDEDMAYGEKLFAACGETGIPARWLSSAEALRLEPNLNPDLKGAIQVPDASFDAMRLPLRWFATARARGAIIRPFHEVTSLMMADRCVTGVRGVDHRAERPFELRADIVVNAAGPWGEKIAAMAGVHVPVQPSPGVMLALSGRLCNMVVTRMHWPGDGDIVVPQRGLSVVGTSTWVVEDPDNLGVPEDHVRKMYEEGAKLIPAVRSAPFRQAWSAARPLIGARGASTGRELSRTFKCFDHLEQDGVEGFVTISGGKATTARAMAETTADVVCRKLGIDAMCKTRDTALLPHGAYYAA
jgi:glycerol-3-phosphate dehydrogenase